MFEIPDDDENFWQALPLDDITNSSAVDKIANSRTKRLSSDEDLQSSVKRLRSGTVKSPELNNRERACMIKQRISPESNSSKTNQNRQFEKLENQHSMKTNRSQHIEMLSPIHPTSRVPSLTPHVVNQEFNPDTITQTKVSKMDSSIQTPVRARRKFPGPAGLLPKISPSSLRENPNLSKQTVCTSPELIQQQDDSIILSSQSSEEVFNEKAWQTLLSDLGEDGKKLMSKFSIAISLQKARKKLLPKGKVPLVIAVIESLDWQGCDASVSLKDKSGKIQGTVHQSLMKEHQCELQPGTVVVLRQVSVISPTSRNHYLNITPANVIAIYSNTPDGLKTIRNIHKTKSLNSILQNIESYLCEEFTSRRSSGPNQTGNHKQNNIEHYSMSPTVINRDFRRDVFDKSHNNIQTPGRLLNLNMDVEENANINSQQNQELFRKNYAVTPRRPNQQTPQPSNKFKFIKTSTVSNIESPKVKEDNSVNTNVNVFMQNSYKGTNLSKVVNDKLLHSVSQLESCSTPKVTSKNYMRNSLQSSVQNSCIGTNHNLCSTQFDAKNEELRKHTALPNCMENDMGNNQSSTRTFNTNMRTDSCSRSPSETSSPSIKPMFKFKSTSNVANPHADKNRMNTRSNNSTANTNTERENVLGRIKQPPTTCFDAESLWQDDLSDDLLSQLSEDML